jgi:hypothetical protein
MLTAPAPRNSQAGVLFFWSSLICRNRCSCCLFKTLALPSTILTALVLVLAGVFYIIGIFGSDVCYDPYTTLSTIVGGADPTLNYYLTCTATTDWTGTVLATVNTQKDQFISSNTTLGTTLAPGLKTLTNSLQQLSAPAGMIAIFNPATPPSTNPMNFNGYNADISTQIVGNGINAVSIIISDILSCEAVQNLIDPFFTSLCTNAITSSIGIARILIAAGVLLFIQLA